MNLRKIAITMGDPAGIGPEIVAKALLNDAIYKNCVPIVVGDMAVLDEALRRFDIHMKPILIDEENIQNVKNNPKLVHIIDTGTITNFNQIRIGEKSELGGKASYKYIVRAVELAKKGFVKGIVTAPINKESIKLYSIPEAGHTEILATLTESKETVTMFTVDKMKIFFHTRHIALRKVIETLSIETVLQSILLAYKSMESIGYQNPKLALAALNPHASDGGLFGDEEYKILKPACEKAMERGFDIAGPVPADSVFHQCLEGKYDAVISLYHDQGHIAAKTYNFYRTVSVTLGLPFIRTSVDHGTAFDIAWKGKANPISMIEAITAGCMLSDVYNPF